MVSYDMIGNERRCFSKTTDYFRRKDRTLSRFPPPRAMRLPVLWNEGLLGHPLLTFGGSKRVSLKKTSCTSAGRRCVIIYQQKRWKMEDIWRKGGRRKDDFIIRDLK